MYTIEKTRKKLKMSQAEIGKLMGMDQQAVAKIETGDRTETRIHVHSLVMIDVISRYGLLSELQKPIDTGADTE